MAYQGALFPDARLRIPRSLELPKSKERHSKACSKAVILRGTGGNWLPREVQFDRIRNAQQLEESPASKLEGVYLGTDI
jgi:hypothetical protein